MKRYEDPEEHFDRHMEQAAAEYVQGMQRMELQPNEKLSRIVARRAAKQAHEDYARLSGETFEHNIQLIQASQKRDMNDIKRRGAKLRSFTCPPLALLFGLLAWYGFGSANLFVGICYSVGSAAFLLMLILGAIFDRPSA